MTLKANGRYRGFYFAPELDLQLRLIAAARNETISNMLREAVEDFVARQKRLVAV